MKDRIIVFGTGRSAENMLRMDYLDDFAEIIAFADNDEEKQGKVYAGKPVIAPSQISGLIYDKIVVASVYFDEIKGQLIDLLEVVKPEVIQDSRDYVAYPNVHAKYRKYYEELGQHPSERVQIIGTNTPIVVYTCITGNYDCLKEIEVKSLNCSYICFTDNPSLKSATWEIRYLEENSLDLTRKARRVKILPHQYLPEYEWSIWLDGRVEIRNDLRELFQYPSCSGITVCPHASRNCVYFEEEICERVNKDNAVIMRKQIQGYREEGYPEHNGLVETGCLLRKHHNVDVQRCMEQWWSEVDKKSCRDQLSFNYVMWKNRVDYDLFDFVVQDNIYFCMNPHVEKRYDDRVYREVHLLRR